MDRGDDALSSGRRTPTQDRSQKDYQIVVEPPNDSGKEGIESNNAGAEPATAPSARKEVQ